MSPFLLFHILIIWVCLNRKLLVCSTWMPHRLWFPKRIVKYFFHFRSTRSHLLLSGSPFLLVYHVGKMIDHIRWFLTMTSAICLAEFWNKSKHWKLFQVNWEKDPCFRNLDDLENYVIELCEIEVGSQLPPQRLGQTNTSNIGFQSCNFNWSRVTIAPTKTWSNQYFQYWFSKL